MALTKDETRTLLISPVADDERFAGRLSEGVYEELRRIAQGFLRGEKRDHTLQSTALVHEAYLRLADHPQLDDLSRTRFMVIAAGEMRRVLIDSARRRDAHKRGGEWNRVTLSILDSGSTRTEVDAEALGGALERLGDLDPRQLQIVELRFFAGMSMRQVAMAIGLSLTTVEDEWYAARAWLRRELSGATA